MYEIELGNAAERGYWKCSPEVRKRLDRAMGNLQQNPFSGKRLKGHYEGLFRIRVGDYRIVYDVIESAGKVLVRAIGPRGGVY